MGLSGECHDVDRASKPTDSITAPVVGSCGLPAWTARVPKLWTGEAALGGVSMEPFMTNEGAAPSRKVEKKAIDSVCAMNTYYLLPRE